MQLLTGIYNGKIDEKGRLSLPARLRAALSSEEVVVLPGLDENHLMLMTPSYFENQFCAPLLSTPMAMMDREKRDLMRRFIAPAQQLEIDSAGRINISKCDGERFGINSKSEVLLMGTGYSVEIWNPDVYQKDLDERKESVSDLAQKIYEEGRK